jgi:reversibly glycosylated polypeptide / UDP-arabinopyranose mutase
MTRIAIAVPTCRYDDQYQTFCEAWNPLFKQHEVILVTAIDGDAPEVATFDYRTNEHRAFETTGFDDLCVKRSSAIRNKAFAVIAERFPEAETIITLDDDVLPIYGVSGDSIAEHRKTLKDRSCSLWTETASSRMRGYPFTFPDEPVMVSHGVWSGIPDFDAPETLVRFTPDVKFEKQRIPRGSFFPMCGMNLAFRREVLPWMYFAPTRKLPGAERFDDIWCGLYLKRELDKRGWAAFTGGAMVRHERASNVFRNLIHEAVGIAVNEHLWRHLDEPEWFRGCDDLPPEHREPVVKFLKEYATMREAWRERMEDILLSMAVPDGSQ